METFNLIAEIFSIVLAGLAIFFSLWYYDRSKETEKQTSNSLTKIETQTDMLQKLTGKWMDRLTKYVTTDKPSPIDTSYQQLITILLTHLPQSMTGSLHQQTNLENQTQQFLTLCIALYFYCAQTNYWSQFYLPKVDEFDETDEQHQLIKRIIDISHSDFTLMATILSNANEKEIEQNQVAHLYKETKEFWQHLVKSSSERFIADQKLEI